MEGSTKIINFISPMVGVHVLGHGQKSYIVKRIISVKIFFSTPRHRTDKLSIQLK